MAQPNQWPNCDQIEGLCPLYEMSQRTGVSILDVLMTFIWRGEPGSRLTLQANRDEWTLQITGAVQRSGGEGLDLEQLQNIGRGLGSTKARV